MTIKKNQLTNEYYFQEGCYITELWNENTDQDVSVAKARLVAGQSTRKHALKATVERYMVLEGQGLVSVGTEPPRVVRQNDIVFIPAGMTQQIKNTGSADLVFLAICTPRFIEENYLAVD